MDPILLKDSFNMFISNLSSWMPEGIIEVDLDLLDELGLLTVDELSEDDDEDHLPHYFHVVETDEKVTLFNHQFSVWIVPKLIENVPVTLVMIALMKDKTPHLEIVFSTSGVYNSPKFVMKLLRHYLSEVLENEDAISSISGDSI